MIHATGNAGDQAAQLIKGLYARRGIAKGTNFPSLARVLMMELLATNGGLRRILDSVLNQDVKKLMKKLVKWRGEKSSNVCNCILVSFIT